eukprot:462362-Prorocentrum_lima.AAC.1
MRTNQSINQPLTADVGCLLALSQKQEDLDRLWRRNNATMMLDDLGKISVRFLYLRCNNHGLIDAPCRKDKKG